MGELTDPGAASMAAGELARAKESVRQENAQRTARRAREARMKGDPAARRALATKFAPTLPDRKL